MDIPKLGLWLWGIPGRSYGMDGMYWPFQCYYACWGFFFNDLYCLVPSIHILLDLYLHTNFISSLENSLASVRTSCGIWCQSKSNFDTVSEHLHFQRFILNKCFNVFTFLWPQKQRELSRMNFARRSARVLGNSRRSTSCSSWTPGVWKTGRNEFGTKSFETKLFLEIPFFLISILRIRVSKRQFRNPTNSGCECEPVPWALTEFSSFGTCIARQVNGTFICYLCLLKKVTAKYGLKLN